MRAYEAGGAGGTNIWLNNGSGLHYNASWSNGFAACQGAVLGCFVTQLNEDTGARLADVNGDGLVDVIRAHINNNVAYLSVWFNNGVGWGSANWIFTGCNGTGSTGCFVGNNHEDLGTRLVDVNGDGLVDVFRAYETSTPGVGQTWIWINNGSGWKYNAEWSANFSVCTSGTVLGCFVTIDNKDRGTRLADVNGDGLVDVFRAYTASSVPYSFTWLNNGNGWNEVNYTFIGCRGGDSTGCFVNNNNEDRGTRLADMNGDGLVDVMRAYEAGGAGGTNIWLNNATGWQFSSNWGNNYEGCNSTNVSGCIVNNNNQDIGTRLTDLNGDGLVDAFRASDIGGSKSWAWPNSGKANYLLDRVDFSLGGGISIDYQKSTSLDNTGNDTQSDLGFNTWLVFNITKNNSVAGAHNTISSTIYNFTDGKFDYKSREFRGFNFAEEKIADKVMKHWFLQDDARSGKEFKTEVLDNQTNPYKTTERTWNSAQQNGYYIVELAQESELDYDNFSSNPKIKNTSYDYDEFGNVIYKHSLGNVTDSNDDKFELYRYINNSDLWIANTLINNYLLASDNSTLLRNTSYNYDNLGFGVPPKKGDITKKEEWFNTTSSAVTLYGYNGFGNMINSTDSNTKLTKYYYGIRDTTNTYPDNMTNAKGHLTNYFYELGTGNMLAEKDSNGFIKNYTYDPLSIEKTVVLPIDTMSLPTQEYSYNFTSTDEGKIIVKQREQSGAAGTLDSYKFYDGFGRLIQTKTEAPNSRQIVVNTYYDGLGRIKEQSNPYFVVTSDSYSAPNTTIAKTTFSYDVLDRVVKIKNSDNTFKNLSYNRGFVALHDENGNVKNYTLNAHNKIIQVTESNGTDNYYTIYNYNGADELTGIIDASSNVTNYTYDRLGRKIKMIDPDMGTWMYQYDAMGNLIKQTDNIGADLIIDYDDLNRKVSENTTARNVTYVYDLFANNTLSQSFASDFAMNYTYDDRLRKISEKKTIDNITTIGGWTYDSSDRVILHTLSSGEIINFTYDEQGLLSSVKDTANAVYNEKNEPTAILYNNALRTNYTYLADNFRLKQIRTPGKQNLNYDYDSVGNVKKIYQSSDTHSTLNYFNNSQTTENLTFISAESITRYFNIPNTTVVSAYLSLSGEGSFPSNGLVLYYDFNSAKELVSGVNNLTNNQGSVAYNNSNCKIGNCSQIFVNNNLRIINRSLGSPFNFSGSTSINFWIRPKSNTAPASDEYVFLSPQNNTNRVSIDDGSRWGTNSWLLDDGAYKTTNRTSPQSATYFMITMTKNATNGNITMYVNSVAENSSLLGNFNGTGINDAQPIQWLLGTNFNNGSDYVGQIDEFGVWNRTLNSSDILSLYNGGNGQIYGSVSSGVIQNPFLEIGTPDGSYEWNYLGNFQHKNNKTNNVAYALNNALNGGACSCTGCILSQGNCTIPFLFHSSSSGILEYSDLLVNFTAGGYNDTAQSRNITMSYDALNRLVYTQIVDTQTTTLNFVYNAIGNMLNMTGTQNAEFYYNSGKAHAPSKVVFY